MADETDRVEPAHILLLQEIDGIAVTFGKQRDEHIGAGYRVLAGRLDMQDGALDHALETGGRLRIRAIPGLEGLVFLIEILPHDIAKIAEIHTAGDHHFGGIGIINQGEQEVFQRRIFVAPVSGIGERVVERLFQVCGETGHLGAFR